MFRSHKIFNYKPRIGSVSNFKVHNTLSSFQFKNYSSFSSNKFNFENVGTEANEILSNVIKENKNNRPEIIDEIFDVKRDTSKLLYAMESLQRQIHDIYELCQTKQFDVALVLPLVRNYYISILFEMDKFMYHIVSIGKMKSNSKDLIICLKKIEIGVNQMKIELIGILDLISKQFTIEMKNKKEILEKQIFLQKINF